MGWPPVRDGSLRQGRGGLFYRFCAEMAELVDAHGSGPCELALMGVRFPPSAFSSLKITANLINPLVSVIYLHSYPTGRLIWPEECGIINQHVCRY